MTFPTDDIFPPPRPATFGPRGAVTPGVVLHTTEAAGTSRAAAVATATWQRTNPGSYNFIVYDPSSAGGRGGALLTVPYTEASGGMNPMGPGWAPERYPWLKALHPAAAYADPNRWLLQLSFSGRTADLAANIGRADVVRMVDVAARLIRWAELQPWGADNLIVSGHMHWQPLNRSDPSQVVIDAVLARYAAIVKPAPAPAPTPPPPDYQALYTAELAKVRDLTGKLTAARAGIAARDAHVDKYPRS